MLEKDLTMVHWPLETEERQIFPSPIAPIGYVWLIADTETMNSLTAVLNEAEQ